MWAGEWEEVGYCCVNELELELSSACCRLAGPSSAAHMPSRVTVEKMRSGKPSCAGLT